MHIGLSNASLVPLSAVQPIDMTAYLVVVGSVCNGGDVALVVVAEEPPDLERLRGAHEVLEALLLDADLAVVHEAQQGGQVRLADVAQDHDRVLARVRLQRESKGR